MQHGFVALGIHLEYRTVPAISAIVDERRSSKSGGAVEVAIPVHDQTGKRNGPIQPREAMKHGLIAIRIELKHDSTTNAKSAQTRKSAATCSRAVEVALLVHDQACERIASVFAARKAIKHRKSLRLA